MLPRNLRRVFYKTMLQPLYAARVLKNRSAAYLHYLLGRGRSSYPEAVTLFLTHRCNLHCKMCGQWGEGGVTKKQSAEYVKGEIPLQELVSFVDDVAAARPNITLFGGEPLLYAGCLALIKHIKRKGMHCLVITNGSLLENTAKDIVESGLDELNVSLDGGRALHDDIRGMPGLFDRIMSGLKKVRDVKIAARRKKPLVNLQCTITKYNYERLDEMLDVAREAGADSLTFHNLIFTSRDVLDKQKPYDELLGCSSGDWEGFIFEPGIDPEALHAKMKDILSGKYKFSVDLYPNFSRKAMAEYYRNPCYMPTEYPARCLSPWIVAYIFPDGEVRPCLNSTYSFGNVRSGKFSDIWNGEKAVRFRQALKEKGLFPACARCTELYRY